MLHALFAEGAPAAPEGGLFGGPLMPLYILGLFMMFMLLVVYPQNRRAKKEEDRMRAELKRGTKVVTLSGIIGTVVAAKDGEDEVTIRSDDTKLRILRSSIAKVIGSDESEAGK